MFTLFRRKRLEQNQDPPPPPQTPEGFIRPEPASVLLATPRRQRLVELIWQRTSVSRTQFATLYAKPLGSYAALVQQFPASESHHHAYLGGMLDHGLESVAYALRLRQSHLLPPGAPPETQAAQAEAWTAGAAYGALLHDIGKIAVDLYVEYEDGSHWHPWHGPLRHPYRFRYRPDREYRLHSAATGLLYTDILDPAILDWLSAFPELWSALLYLLAGRNERAGVLGELVLHADQASTAAALGGDPQRARAAPQHALQRKLLDGLRYLVREQLKLNQPNASDGWLTDEGLWLVSKTVCDKLRAHLLSQGIEGVPASNIAVFDVLQEHGIAQPTADGKAIWKATVTSTGGWKHNFTFLRIAPALIWDTNGRPAVFQGSVRVDEIAADDDPRVPSGSAASVRATPVSAASTTNSSLVSDTRATDSIEQALALLGHANSEPPVPTPSEAAVTETDVTSSVQVDTHQLQQPGDSSSLRPAPCASNDPLGTQFLAWLRGGIETQRLIINDAKALVHTVAGTAFVASPGVFQRFVQEHPEVARLALPNNGADWAFVQKQFERLHVHKKQDSGLNIWMCEVSGPRKTRRLHGYLFLDGRTVFSHLPPDNPYLKLLTPTDAPRTDAA